MQTFLPYPNFIKSLNALDNKRLGKQRVEAMQILNILKGRAKPHLNTGRIAWANHPAVLMWKGYEDTLAHYYNMTLTIWVEKGFKNNMTYETYINSQITYDYPEWIYDPKFCLSHQSNLIRKDPTFYRPIFGNDIPDDLEYFWPTKEGY